ncbi:MAG: hypothetical protein K9G49_11755 [Taibaiella sp.]|nr:hypothetical protein [Taibaiella sp.]
MQTKKIRFIFQFMMFFATFFSVARAQTPGGLTASDLNSIVQKCIDLPGIQTFYPADGSGHLNQINIVNYPYVFPSGMTVSKDGQAVEFISNESFSKSPVAEYFMFRRIMQTGTTVKLIGNYYYTVSGNHLNKSIAIDYSQSAGVWTITNSTIN